MEKTTVAVCLVMVVLGMTFAMNLADTGAESPARFQDSSINLDVANYSDCRYAGNFYTIINLAEPYEYQGRTNFKWNQLIIDMEVVPEYAFLDAEFDEIMLTERVKRIETGAFKNVTELMSITTYGQNTSFTIEEGAFEGCTNLVVADMRNHGYIHPNAFPDSDRMMIVIDDRADIPDIPHKGVVDLTAMDKADVLHVNNWHTYSSGKNEFGIAYLGYGKLQSTDSLGTRTTVTNSIDTYWDMYRFDYGTGDLTIDYLDLGLRFEGFGIDRTVRLDDYEVALPVPEGYEFESGFKGWRVAGGGAVVGLTIDRDKVRNLGTGLTLEPVMDAFTITFDVSGLPAGETVPDIGDMRGDGDSRYPTGGSEHYDITGWKVGDVTYQPGDRVRLMYDHTATAVWTAKQDFTYTVRYQNADGSDLSVREISHGMTFTIGSETPNDVPIEKRFIGWRVDGAGDIRTEGSSFAVTADTVLVPVLQDRPVHTVTYVSDDSEIFSDSVIDGQPYTVRKDAPKDATRYFVQWNHAGGSCQPGDPLEVTGDVVLTAQWVGKPVHQVIYIIDGREFFRLSEYEGDTHTVSHSEPDDERRYFVGWAYDGRALRGGDTFTVTAETELVAMWKERPMHTVTYTDGGEFRTVREYEGSLHTVIPDVPEGDGVFLGWSDGSATYAAGETIEVAGDVVLTAQWRERMTFDIVYMNGGEFLRETATEGVPYRITNGHPEDAERYFVGWSDGTSTHAGGDTIDVRDDIVLTAVWRDRPMHSVTYEVDGGEFRSFQVREGCEHIVIADVPEDPERIFTGWVREGSPVDAGETLTIGKDTVISADWRARGSYSVTYMTDGGEFLRETAREGIPYTVTTTEPSDPDRYFVRWSDGTGVFDGGDVVDIVHDTVLTAEWVDRPMHTVTYVVDGDPRWTFDVREGSVHSVVSDEPSDPDRYFVGWSYDGSTLTAGQEVTVDGDVSLTAVWTERPMHSVMYTVDGEPYRTFEVREGATHSIISDTPEDPERYFVGWSDGDGLVVDTVTVDGDVVLTAVWKDRPLHTVTYVVDGRTVSETEVREGSIHRIVSDEPSDPDRYFVGWSYEEGTLTAGMDITVDGDVVLTAVWKERPIHTVTYNVNGVPYATYEVREGATHSVISDIPEDAGRIFTHWDLDGRTLNPGDGVTVEGDIVIDAEWRDRLEYSVTYLADGETFLTDTATEGVVYTLTDSEPTDGERYFVCWNDGTGDLSAGESVLLDGDATFTAVWRERPLHTVTYVVDGDQYGAFEVREGTVHTVTVTDPTDDARYFVGWSDGESTLTSGDTLVVGGDVVLDAVWEDRPVHTVTYLADGGEFRTVREYEGSVHTVISDEPTDPDRYFVGWSDGAGLVGDTLPVEGDIVLTAVWKDRPMHTITYVVDGDTRWTFDVREGSVHAIVSDEPADPDRYFVGWSCDGDTLTADQELTVNGDIVLTAVWTERPMHTVTYVVNGEPYETFDVREGAVHTIASEEPTDPERYFVGWSYGGSTLTAGREITVDGDVSLMAVWKDRPMHTVTYVVDNKPYGTFEVREGNVHRIVSDEPADPDRYFVGWSDGAGLVGDTVLVDSDMTLTAVWTDRPIHTVTYVVDGGTYETLEVREGNVHTIASEGPTDPERYFVGWSDGETTLSTGQEITVDGDVTLTAVWKDRPIHTVTYVTDGSEFLTVQVREGTEHIVVTDEPSDPMRWFVGWMTGDDRGVTAGDSFVVDGDVTLTAVWTDKAVFTVTYVVDGAPWHGDRVTEGSAYSVTGEVPESAGRIFDGWTDGKTTLSPGQPLTVTSDTVLEARWTDAPMRTVTFLVDGEAFRTEEAREGTELTIPESVPEDPERYFVGWSCGERLLTPGETVAVDGDITLTAEWRDRPYRAVAFIVDGEVFRTDAVPEGSEYTVPDDDLSDGTRWFVGWVDGEGTAVSGTITVEADRFLFAAWEDRADVTVSYVVDGAEFLVLTAYEGTEQTVAPDVPTDPERVFEGWDAGDGRLLSPGDAFVADGDTVLTAVWSDIPSVTVSFEAYGETMLEETVLQGSEYMIGFVPDLLDGDRFDGWELGGRILDEGDSFTADGDVVLTAVVSAVPEHTVTYVSDGRTVAVFRCLEGSEHTVTGLVPAGERVFAGWELGGNTVNGGHVFTVTADTVLTAVWKDPAVHRVTYVSDGRTFLTETAADGYRVTSKTPDGDGRFAGWSFGGTVLHGGDDIDPTGDVVLTALWEDVEFTVTYVVDDRNVSVVKVPEGGTVVVAGAPDIPDGEFACWYDGVSKRSPGDRMVVEGNVFLHAVKRCGEETGGQTGDPVTPTGPDDGGRTPGGDRTVPGGDATDPAGPDGTGKDDDGDKDTDTGGPSGDGGDASLETPDEGTGNGGGGGIAVPAAIACGVAAVVACLMAVAIRRS